MNPSSSSSAALQRLHALRSRLLAAAAFVVISFAVIGWWLLTHPFATEPFMPHRTCYLNSAPLIWFHVVSDFLIGAAYVAISTTLAYLVARSRREIPFHWMMLAFAVFIIACGATHWMEVWTVWTPRYWLAGAVKAVTAIASVLTALLLPPLVPKVRALLEAARVSTQRKLDLEEKNTELATLYERIKQLDELKTNFFANVSHEFRTPLTLILGPVDRMLTQSEVSEHTRHELGVIRRNALILHKHVNDLLDASKLEAGKMEVAYANTDIARLARIVFAYFDTVAQERLVKISVSAPDSLMTQLDAEKIERVLINLFSNAMKFTPEGGQVQCSVAARDGHVLIEVEDSGPGVPVAMRDTIFERFHQGETGTTRRFGGTGLGLAIVKEFVELHRGSVHVGDSSLGGAAFCIEIPLKAPPSATVDDSASRTGPLRVAEPHIETLRQETQRARGTPAGESSWIKEQQLRLGLISAADSDGSPQAEGEKSLVLVVEDTMEMNRFIAQILSPEFRVMSAFNGAQGLERATALLPDLVITDMMMPEMGGDELLNRLRQNPRTSAIPVILLTARADESLKMNLLRTGAQDYVTKPFVVDELRTRARNLVAAKRARDTLQHELDSHTHDIAMLAKEVTVRSRELQAAKETAEAANRAKDQFLAVLSHELRTPLTPVLTAVSNLRSGDGGLTGEVHDVLSMVQRNVELEARLIDDLLDLTRVSKGKLQLNLDVANIHELITHAIEICESEVTNKRLTVGTELQAHKPFARVDSARLLQVFWNLLHNAVKFTQQGGRVAVRTSNPDEQTLRIEIMDTGIGIEPEILPKIFDAFEQGNAAITRRFGGLGLGLALSRALIEAHGGKISASSPGKDQGATFAMELSALEAPAPREPDRADTDKAAQSSGGGEKKRLRILLVEDHDDTRTTLVRLLGKWGYSVESAATVRAGLDAFEAEKGGFDLLISDLGLPDATGADLMRELRKRSGTLVGIAISGYGMEHDIANSKAAGFSEHITKPVSAQKLKAVIHTLTSPAV